VVNTPGVTIAETMKHKLLTFKRLLVALVVISFSGCMTVEKTTVDGRDVNNVKASQEHVKAAMGYLSQRQLGDAQRHLIRALELDPNSVTAHNAMALSYSMTGEYELSEDKYRELLALAPNFSAGRNNYAALLFQLQRIPEACAQWQIVVSDALYDKRSAAYYNLGQCRLAEDKYDSAVIAFERSVALDSNNVDSFLELSELNYGKGEYDLAQDYYDKYRQMSGRVTPKSLLLGIKLSVESGDDNAHASRALALKSLFPESIEYREYQRRARIQ